MRLVFTSLALLAGSSALECYVGRLPDGWRNQGLDEEDKQPTIIPKLTQCPGNEQCCKYGWNYFIGKFYNCSKRCPDFREKAEDVDILNSDGFERYCTNAVGGCKYNQG